MINKSNLKDLLDALHFVKISTNIYEKNYPNFDCTISIDTKNEKIIYPEDKGMKIDRHTTDNFSANENYVVLECVDRLLTKGYRPEDIELEKKWSLGHMVSGGEDSGFADICVHGEDGKVLFIIECKTEGKEYSKELKNTENYGGQLFTYWQQERNCNYLVLYASKLSGNNISYDTESVDCSDDPNILTLAKKDDSIHLYKDANTVEELYECWDETYEKRFCGDVIFRDDSVAYNIGVKPLRKCDLKDFSENDKIVNKFEEILRHNNVSDKENAFNRLIALFICKLVDEIQKGENDEVDFQYKVGTDTYESLQDRLQRLHKEGMEKFMREEIFYVPDTYAEDLVQQYSGYKRKNMIEDLKKTIRILKFYSNNDFAFKDVHNEELFYQNGKIVVEVVQLFEPFRIIGSKDVQMLGDLFEQLLNKGFKQNEGQFFTPIPITRFIWDSLPVKDYIKKDEGLEYPRIIDYACGAGHFLTQGVEAVNAAVKSLEPEINTNRKWVENKVYGIEKDYRLARVSKISLFMHGAGDANIIFGDGLENYADKGITPESFDILVANPPYSVKAFKSHMKLKDNDFNLLAKITNDGSEIETLFVERISQLLKPNGIAAVILPSSILSNDSGSYTGAREELLQHFFIRAITCFGSKTFGATGTNTVVLFLQKIDEPPVRFKLVEDSANAILSGKPLSNWEDEQIFEMYLSETDADEEFYKSLIQESEAYDYFEGDKYLKNYIPAFKDLPDVKNKLRQKTFQKLSDEEKNTWLNQRFYSFVKEHEKEKLMYFAMIYQQTVLIITSPADNAEQKIFLGYDWSNRKGSEGIVINTPGGKLYDDKDRFADNTISGMIRNSFKEKEMSVPEYKEYYRYANLKDMIDFSRVEFNKAIKTTSYKKFEINSKYPLIQIDKLVNTIGGLWTGEKPPFKKVNVIRNTNFRMDGSLDLHDIANIEVEEAAYSNRTLQRGDIIIEKSGGSETQAVGRVVYFNLTQTDYSFSNFTTRLRVINPSILPKYLFLVLNACYHMGFTWEFQHGSSGLKNLNLPCYLANKIPVPPLDIQQKLVDECSIIDKEYSITQNKIEEYKTTIENMFSDINRKSSHTVRLDSSDLFSIGIGRRILKKQITENGIPIYSANVNKPFGHIESTFFEDYSVGTVIWGIDGDWDVNYIPPETPFYPTDHCGTLRVLTDKINEHYIAFALKEEGKHQRFTRSNRASTDRIKSLHLTLPDKEQQDKFIDKVNDIEAKISALEDEYIDINDRKQEILKQYL